METFTMSRKDPPGAGFGCRRPSPTDVRPAGSDRAAPFGALGPTPRAAFPPSRGSRAARGLIGRPRRAIRCVATVSIVARGGARPGGRPAPQVYRRRSIEAGDVGGQVLDILLREELRDARHRARVIGPAPRLERLELLDDVLGMLAGESGGLVLPGESAQMAHRAEHLRRLRSAR